MKALTFILSLVFYLNLSAQELEIDRITHDFGVINNWAGLQNAEFRIVNTSKRSVFTKTSLETSCGCSVVSLSKDKLKSKDTSYVLIIYDPIRDEGKTTKSATISFKNKKGKNFTFSLNLNSFVLTDNLLEELRQQNAHVKDSLNKAALIEKYASKIKYVYRQTKKLSKFNSKSKAYKKFIDKATMEALFNNYVKININVKNKSSEYAFGKVLKELHQDITKDLESKGIPIEKIIFDSPTAELSADSSFIQLSILENYDELIEMEMRINSKSKFLSYSPSYAQKFYATINDIDTTAPSFQSYLLRLKEYNKETAKTYLVVFSSSSNSPNKNGKTPLEVSNIRGERVKSTLLKSLLNSGQDTSRFAIDVIPFVDGPKYDEFLYRKSSYRVYQGISIVQTSPPILKPLSESKFFFTQNFYKGSYAINTSLTIYKEMISSIQTEIQNKGFAQINITGSASKIPNYEFRTKYMVANQRIESLKKSILEACYIKGIDSKKLIFSKREMLVGGPEYDKNDAELFEFYGLHRFVTAEIY